jgi:hypothetical protein
MGIKQLFVGFFAAFFGTCGGFATRYTLLAHQFVGGDVVFETKWAQFQLVVIIRTHARQFSFAHCTYFLFACLDEI